MKHEYFNVVRQSIVRHVGKMRITQEALFPMKVREYLSFLRRNPLCYAAIELLMHRNGIVADKVREIIGEGRPVAADDEQESAAIAYEMLLRCEKESSSFFSRLAQIFTGSSERWPETFITLFVEPLQEYLLGNIDNGILTIHVLSKYKHRSEWFHADRLRAILQADTAQGEKRLMLDLFEYLHDHGIPFTISPWSVAGVPDLVMAQEGEDMVIADGKIFDITRGRGKDSVLRGFRQVYDYTCTFQKPVGYVIIYKVCEPGVDFRLPCSASLFPFCHVNGKTILFVEIDIHEYAVTASKRPVLKTVVIQGSDLMMALGSE